MTVEDITSEAGFAKGSFYSHFRSKSDILLEEFRDIDNYYREIRDQLNSKHSSSEQLENFTAAQLRYFRDNVGITLLRIMYINILQSGSLADPLIDSNRYLHSLVKELIDQGQQRGDFRCDEDSETLTICFNQSMRSQTLYWVMTNDDFDLESEGLRYFQTMILPSLLKSAEKKS